jgi:type IV secretory pathway VirB3-like protein
MLGTKGPVMSATESIIIVCVVILIFYGFYLALFGEKKMRRLALIGEKRKK